MVNPRTPFDELPLLNNEYAVYDSGGIGELDVRALLKQYGERKIADELSSAWQGGAYVTYRRTKAGAAAEIAPNVSDLALLYVSHWKSAQAAERFAHFYAGAVSQRYRSTTPQAQPACSGECPVSSVEVATEEEPVIVEHWADNSVIVSESFDATTAAKLRGAVRSPAGGTHAENQQQNEQELGMRLYELPAFREFEAAVGEQIAGKMISACSQ